MYVHCAYSRMTKHCYSLKVFVVRTRILEFVRLSVTVCKLESVMIAEKRAYKYAVLKAYIERPFYLTIR